MSLNLDLLEFHVREATQELDLLQDAIQYARDGTRRKGAVGDEPLRWPLQEGALAVSLEQGNKVVWRDHAQLGFGRLVREVLAEDSD